MNFLLHRHLAELELGSPRAGIGAMLPDLWRMADRRVRPRRDPGDDAPAPGSSDLASLLAGVAHHVSSDAWFHRSRTFREGERRTADRLREASPGTPRLALFAHVTWEMCLDGALVRARGLDVTLGVIRDGVGGVTDELREAASLHHFARVAREPTERDAFERRMARLWHGIAEGPWIDGYQDGAGLAERLEGVRRRIGFAPFSVGERERLAAALEILAGEANAALVDLFAERAASRGA